MRSTELVRMAYSAQDAEHADIEFDWCNKDLDVLYGVFVGEHYHVNDEWEDDLQLARDANSEYAEANSYYYG